MTTDRWQGHLPTQVELECSGEHHWVRWEDGELFALNHADAEGERTLAALAGERPACIELLDLWKRHEDDLRVLVLTSRGPGDPITRPDALGSGPVVATVAPLRRQIGPPRPQIGRMATHMGGVMGSAIGRIASSAPARLVGTRRTAPGPRRGPVEDPLVDLVSMSGPLIDRLVAMVAMAWAERLVCSDAVVTENRAALEAALYGRACLAIRTWLGAPGLDVSVRLIPEGQRSSITRDDNGVTAWLPFSWICDVWARGLSVIMGRFVLLVERAGDSSLLLQTANSDFSLSSMTINL